jgi:hypothetical protein
MEENKTPVDFTLLNVAIGNVLNDLVYYQLRDIKQTRPLSKEGEAAYQELEQVMCFKKTDRDIKLLSSIQDSIEEYLKNSSPED